MLIDNVRRNKNNSGHSLQGCKLGIRYIRKISNKLPSMYFTNSIVKIENNNIESITIFKYNTCSSLLVNDKANQSKTFVSPSSSALVYQEHCDLFKRTRYGKFLLFYCFRICLHLIMRIF